MVNCAHYCCSRICKLSGRNLQDDSVDRPAEEAAGGRAAACAPSRRRGSARDCGSVRKDEDFEPLRLSGNLFAPRNPSFPCNSYTFQELLRDSDEEDGQYDQHARGKATSSSAAQGEYFPSEASTLFEASELDEYSRVGSLVSSPEQEQESMNGENQIHTQTNGGLELDGGGHSTQCPLGKQSGTTMNDCSGSTSSSAVQASRGEESFAPSNNGHDPLQRTASERRLAGEAVDAFFVGQCGADDHTENPLKRSPSEQLVCDDAGVWPPRASFFVALEARNSILQRRPHSSQSSPLRRSLPSLPSLPEVEDVAAAGGMEQDVQSANTYLKSSMSLETRTTAPGESMRFDEVTPSSSRSSSMPRSASSGSVCDAPENSGLFSWLFGSSSGSRRAQTSPPPSPLHLDPGASPQSTTEALLRDIGLPRKPGTRVCGAIMLSGSLRAKPTDICDAIRRALTVVLHPAVEHRAVVCVWHGFNVSASNVDTDMTKEASSSELAIKPGKSERFRFELVLQDSSAILKAFEALRLEAASAGALCLLPTLADALPDADRLSLRMEIGPMPTLQAASTGFTFSES